MGAMSNASAPLRHREPVRLIVAAVDAVIVALVLLGAVVLDAAQIAGILAAVTAVGEVIRSLVTPAALAIRKR